MSWRTCAILSCFLLTAASGLGGCGDDGPTSTEGTEAGDGDGDVDVCAAASEDDDCDTCTKASCCENLTACVGDADCLCVTDCIDMGGDSASCHTDCSLSTPNPNFSTLSDCWAQSCSAECS
jgi:hypothetical protein